MRLFHKFLAALMAVALGPLLLAGWRLAGEAERTLRANSLRAQRRLAEHAAESVRSYLDDARSLLALVGRNIQALSGDRKSGERMFASLLNHYPLFMDVAALDRRGRTAYALGHSVRRAGPFFRDWSSAMDRVEKSGAFFGEVDTEGHYPVLKVAAPFETLEGEPAGVLAARVNLLDLNGRLGGLDLGTDGRVLVLDRGGRVVAASSRGGPSADDFREREEALSDTWREGEYGPAGARILGVKTPVPGTEWTLIYEQPAAEVFRVVEEARRRIDGFLVLSGVLAAVLCLFLTRAVVRPLREFQAVVRKMREGEFGARITTDSRDEMGTMAQELREAQKVMGAKVRQATIGLMAHRVGHDLRQPLTAVGHSLEVIRRHVAGADDTARKHFALVDEELHRGREYIDELLALGRERPPEFQSTDLNRLVRELAASFSVPEGVRLTTSLADGLSSLALDPGQIRRALANLISNALEAVSEKGTVEVRTDVRDGRVLLRVTDDGCGIAEDLREKVFEEFFTTKPQGTGLGMGIVKKVAEAHGGTLRLDSGVGRGTTVELSLPMKPC